MLIRTHVTQKNSLIQIKLFSFSRERVQMDFLNVSTISTNQGSTFDFEKRSLKANLC